MGNTGFPATSNTANVVAAYTNNTGATVTSLYLEFDYEKYLEFDTTKSDGQYKKTASNEKFRKYNPDFCFTQIEKGLQETITWFKENYPKIRK